MTRSPLNPRIPIYRFRLQTAFRARMRIFKSGISGSDYEGTSQYSNGLAVMCELLKQAYHMTHCYSLSHSPFYARRRRSGDGQTKILDGRTNVWELIFEVLFKATSPKSSTRPFEKHFENAFPNVRSAIQNLRLGSIHLTMVNHNPSNGRVPNTTPRRCTFVLESLADVRPSWTDYG
jgi:hypothetical protein